MNLQPRLATTTGVEQRRPALGDELLAGLPSHRTWTASQSATKAIPAPMFSGSTAT
jgi:hypothetical protein